jgi:hypothetical protein
MFNSAMLQTAHCPLLVLTRSASLISTPRATREHRDQVAS